MPARLQSTWQAAWTSPVARRQISEREPQSLLPRQDRQLAGLCGTQKPVGLLGTLGSQKKPGVPAQSDWWVQGFTQSWSGRLSSTALHNCEEQSLFWLQLLPRALPVDPPELELELLLEPLLEEEELEELDDEEEDELEELDDEELEELDDAEELDDEELEELEAALELSVPVTLAPELDAVVPPSTHRPWAVQTPPPWQSESTAHCTEQMPETQAPWAQSALVVQVSPHDEPWQPEPPSTGLWPVVAEQAALARTAAKRRTRIGAVKDPRRGRTSFPAEAAPGRGRGDSRPCPAATRPPRCSPRSR